MAKFNKSSLIERVLEFDNFETKKQATDFVNDLLNIIKNEVLAGSVVSLSEFGKFEKYKMLSGKNKIRFTSFKAFKNAANL